jgi:gas vesicle protein
MADGYDRFENEGGGGGSFVIGLLTGTVLGAGLGMLFAPKPGSDLRNQLSEQAGNLANTASEQYRRASETAGGLADRGREIYGKARDAVVQGAEEAQRYVRETTGSAPSPANAPATSGTSGSSVFGGSDMSRGTSSESMRGAASTPLSGTGSTSPGSSGPKRS